MTAHYAVGQVGWLSATSCQIPYMDYSHITWNGGSKTLPTDEQTHILNHLRVWRHIIENDLDYALITEANVSSVLHYEDFNRMWKRMLTQLKDNKNVNLIQLHTTGGQGKKSNLEDGVIDGTGMYFITQEGARRLAKHWRESPISLEELMVKESGLHFAPSLAETDGNEPKSQRAKSYKDLPWCYNFVQPSTSLDLTPVYQNQ